MKLGIGAIPQNLIIKSGGFTYYPLNQFEIDGTVAIELYRQDSDGDKKKIFIFKGEKDELKKFKARFPVLKKMRSYNEYGSGSARQRKMVSINTSDSYLLYKLAENLSAEAAAFNKKIKTGGKLTLNESIAAGRSVSKVLSLSKDKNYPKTTYKPIAVKKTKSLAAKKVAIKKPTIKKAAVKKTITKKSPLRQTGSSNKKYDERVSAMKPGKRTSASGGVYYERRADHSDKGKNL